jgi:asparagine synthase (glutamine-hydrolysing)
MCGIAGIVDFGGEAIDEVLVKRMATVVRHRGPDDEGFFFDGLSPESSAGAVQPTQGPRVALAARRLAVIDIAGGHQPLGNEDGTVWVAFNGEIYNYREILQELLAQGHVFRTRCDTETIVHAYEEWGDECVSRFNGMFAFAVWDKRNRRLLLARDRLGVKPLAYVQRGGRLLFASEIKSLLEDPLVGRDVDGDVLMQYLSFFAIPEPHSLFKGIMRLPAGHILIFQDGKAELKRYWDIDCSETLIRTERQWLKGMEALLEDAVRLRLVSDVPLGAFLSGGIDSSLIVAMMARAGGGIKTVSIEFPPGDSEFHYAQLVADRFGTDHHVSSFERDEVWAQLPEMIRQHDEPSQSLIQSYFVSLSARRHVTVALSGVGADELFTGYPSHKAAQYFHYAGRLPQPLRRAVRRLMPETGNGRAGRLQGFLDAVEMKPELVFASRYLHATRERDRLRILSPDFLSYADSSAASDYLMRLFATANSRDFMGRLLYVDQKAYLVNELLRTTDSMSMAHSLEVRTPFLDYRVVELVAKMPTSMKIRGLTTKYALRKLAEKLLPKEIAHRPKKGFTVPLRQWISPATEVFVRDTLASDTLTRQGYFEPAEVIRLIDEHFSGQRDNSLWIMMLVTYHIWHRVFIDRAPAVRA